jgi:integrase
MACFKETLMACVTKRKGKWGVDFRDHTGTRHWKVAPGNTRKAADSLLAELTQKLGRGEYDPLADKKTMDELVEVHRKAHVNVNVRESTKKDYDAVIDLHILPYFSGRRLRTLTLQTIEAWRQALLAGELPDGSKREEGPVGRRTVNKAHTRLGAMLQYAVRNRWLAHNVARDMEKLRDERAEDHRPIDECILTPPEIRLLLDHTDARWRPLFFTAIFTGLRQGELLGLKWGDIDWQSRRIHVSRQFTKGRFTDLKTKYSRRRVDMADDLVSVLRVWKLACPKASSDDTDVGDADLVFPHTDGRPLNHGLLLRNGFYPALRRAKLRQVRFHDLRHTFASLLIAANVHPKRIQALMGHSTIRVTMDVYGHLMNDTDNEAANKITALVRRSGDQTVTSARVSAAESSQVIEKLEAGVGIEPAYTALQAAA